MSGKLTSLAALLKEADTKDPIIVSGKDESRVTPFIDFGRAMGPGTMGGVIGLGDDSPGAVLEQIARLKEHGVRRFVLTKPDGEKSPPAPGIMFPQDMYEQKFDGVSMSDLAVGGVIEIKHPTGAEPSCFVERVEDGDAPEFKVMKPGDLPLEMKVQIGRELAKQRLLEGLRKGGPEGLKDAVKDILAGLISGNLDIDVPDDWDCGDPDCEGCKARKAKFKKDED